jgi:hypothetical protein
VAGLRWSMGNSPGAKKRRTGGAILHPQKVSHKDQLPIFEFESVCFSLGRSCAFDLDLGILSGCNHTPYARSSGRL